LRRSNFILVGVIVVVLSGIIGTRHAASDGGSTIYLPLIATTKLNPLHQGIATYYGATGDGACMFGPSPNNLMVTALNAVEYSNAAYCGAYVQVNGAKGSITVASSICARNASPGISI